MLHRWMSWTGGQKTCEAPVLSLRSSGRNESASHFHSVWNRTQCIHCGPLVVYDLVKEADDDEDEALDIMDNMKDAFAGRYAPALHRHMLPSCVGGDCNAAFAHTHTHLATPAGCDRSGCPSWLGRCPAPSASTSPGCGDTPPTLPASSSWRSPGGGRCGPSPVHVHAHPAFKAGRALTNQLGVADLGKSWCLQRNLAHSETPLC